MEYQEFCKQRDRMCDKYECPDYPINHMNFNEFSCESWTLRNPKKAEKIIEQWAKEHPIITNADKFKEVFGKPIGSYGAPCPNGLTIYGIGATSNLEWLEQEYKEPKEDNN